LQAGFFVLASDIWRHIHGTTSLRYVPREALIRHLSQGQTMRAWKRAILAAVMSCAWMGAQAAEKIPVEAFARFGKLSSPALSPDGKYLAASLDLDHGASALAVYRLADMTQTALLKFPRYELATQVAWVSATRLVIAKGRKVGNLEKPRPNGEIIASNFDGTGQKYIYGYEQRATNSTLDRGFGYI
jgi:hypothetical protein